MDITDIKTFLAAPMAEVSALMDESLKSDIALLDATNRSLLSQGGKMMRPVLSLLAAGACGGIKADSIRFAAAAEMIHNATLLHDDVVDGASLRRGRPTVMSILNGPASVLVGDYWLVKAIRCILDADRYSERVIRLFSKTLSDLAEGELLQLQKASNADTTREDYIHIIYSKTASLFGLDAAVNFRVGTSVYPKAVVGFFSCKSSVTGSGTSGLCAGAGLTFLVGGHFAVEAGLKYYPKVNVSGTTPVSTAGTTYDFPTPVEVLGGGIAPVLSIGWAF